MRSTGGTQPRGGEQDTDIALTHGQIMAVLAGVMIGMLLAALDQSIVATALPTIAGDLGSLDQLSWVVTAYLLTATAATPLFGKLGDLHGRRRMFQSAIVIFLVGSALCAVAGNMGLLIGAHALQGIGAGGILSMAWAVVGDVVPPRSRGRYQGYLTAVFATASVSGPLLGGFFVDHLSWRWAFTINLPLGGVALVITTLFLRLPDRRIDRSLDYLGATLLVGSVSALLLVSVWGGEEYAWDSPTIGALGVTAVGLAVLFVAQERRAAEPILPLRLFRNPTFRIATSVSVIVGPAVYGIVVFMPLFFQVVHGSTATASGLLTAPLTGGILALAIYSGRRISKRGRYRMFPVIGTACTAVGLVLGAITTSANAGLWAVAPALVLIGAGLGMTMHVMMLAAQNAVPKGDLGVTSSAISFCRSLGSVLGTALFSAVLNHGVSQRLSRTAGTTDDAAITAALHGTPSAIAALPAASKRHVLDAFADSFRVSVGLGVVFAVVSLVLVIRLPNVELRDTLGEPDVVMEPTLAV